MIVKVYIPAPRLREDRFCGNDKAVKAAFYYNHKEHQKSTCKHRYTPQPKSRKEKA